MFLSDDAEALGEEQTGLQTSQRLKVSLLQSELLILFCTNYNILWREMSNVEY